MPGAVAVAARKLPEVRSVAAISQVNVRLDGYDAAASAASAAAVAENFVVTMHEGRLADLVGDGVLVDASTASAQGWRVGDVLPATVGNLTDHDLTVSGSSTTARRSDRT